MRSPGAAIERVARSLLRGSREGSAPQRAVLWFLFWPLLLALSVVLQTPQLRHPRVPLKGRRT
jgi:hypothetical protein